mgnify:CR=1 FL=1
MKIKAERTKVLPLDLLRLTSSKKVQYRFFIRCEAWYAYATALQTWAADEGEGLDVDQSGRMSKIQRI